MAKDEDLDELDALLEKISLHSKRIKKLPKNSSAYYRAVADMAKISPEPGYRLLDNAAIGVHLVNPDGEILWANKCELKSLGYEPHEYFGKSINEFHMDDDVIGHILETLTSGYHLDSYPARLKMSNGEIAYVLINSNVFVKNAKFIHTRCFTIKINKAVYLKRKECLNEED